MIFYDFGGICKKSDRGVRHRRGQQCGVEPQTQDSETTYTMWYGEVWKDYDNIDDLLSDGFFDGESLQDIFPSIDVWF